MCTADIPAFAYGSVDLVLFCLATFRRGTTLPCRAGYTLGSVTHF